MASCWLNSLTVGIVKYVQMIVPFMFVFNFFLTEQLPGLGGLYRQGWQTAVATQVRVYLCAYRISMFL